MFQSTVPQKLHITTYLPYKLQTRWIIFILENAKNKHYSTHGRQADPTTGYKENGHRVRSESYRLGKFDCTLLYTW
jgi:hypothetical protein